MASSAGTEQMPRVTSPRWRDQMFWKDHLGAVLVVERREGGHGAVRRRWVRHQPPPISHEPRRRCATHEHTSVCLHISCSKTQVQPSNATD